MPNQYFQFKQFTIFQDRCALKVSTDSCVFGAWLASKVGLLPYHANSCLDIGAGSGLLMLMLAQQFAGSIDGVEIDRPSFEQANENISASPWKNRLRIFNQDAKLFTLPQPYDIIFSNPPFYEGDLKSSTVRYNIAKHNDGLTLTELLEVVARNLSAKGIFAVLLPFRRSEWFVSQAAACGLYLSGQLSIRQSVQHPFIRSVLLFDRADDNKVKREELVIKTIADKYTPEFTELLKEYYLYL